MDNIISRGKRGAGILGSKAKTTTRLELNVLETTSDHEKYMCKRKIVELYISL